MLGKGYGANLLKYPLRRVVRGVFLSRCESTQMCIFFKSGQLTEEVSLIFMER